MFLIPANRPSFALGLFWKGALGSVWTTRGLSSSPGFLGPVVRRMSCCPRARVKGVLAAGGTACPAQPFIHPKAFENHSVYKSMLWRCTKWREKECGRERNVREAVCGSEERTPARASGRGWVGEGGVWAEKGWIFNEWGGQSLLKEQYRQKHGCEKGQGEWFRQRRWVSLGWQVGCLEEYVNQ